MVTRIAGVFAAALLGAARALAADFETTFPEDSNKEAVIRHLRPVLEPIDGAARVYAVVDCHGLPATRFPEVTLQMPEKAKNGPEAVREIFAKDKQTIVTLDPTGMPRIEIGKSPSALLQTKIHRLRFTPRQRYNIVSAELAIEKTAEVQAAIRRLHLQEPVTVISENVQDPMEDIPHLPATLKDITLDQALDLLAKTFASVIFYQECADSKDGHFFSIDHGCIVCGPWRHSARGRTDPVFHLAK